MTDERERIRKEKIERLKEQASTEESSEQSPDGRKKSDEEKIEELVTQATTSAARKRLNTVEMAKPELARAVKKQIAQVQAAGRLAEEIDEEKMKSLLSDANEQSSTNFDIKRR